MDARSLYSIYHDDPFYRPLLEKFSKNIGNYVEKLEKAARRGEALEIKNAAHEIKGVFGAYGFPQVADLANRLQVSYEPSPEMAEALSRLLDDLRRVQETYPAAD